MDMETLKNNPKHVLYWTAAAALVIGALASLWYVSAYARSLRPEGGWNTISVSAEGTANRIPDIAQISFSVNSDGGKDLAKIQEDNTNKMNEITKYLDEQGVKKEDIKTSSYNVSPRYQYFPCTAGFCRPAEVTGYTISQTVEVKVRDTAKAGDLIAGSVERGANGITGPNFVVDDETEAADEARGMAIEKARAKAEQIAEQSGLRLGKLLNVSEDNYGGEQPMYDRAMGMGAMEAQSNAAAPALQPGSQEVKANVTLTYSVR